MKTLGLLALFFCGVAADFDAPQVTIDLDKEPEDRWAPVFLDTIKTHGFDNSFGPMLKYIENILPFSTWLKYDKVLQAVGKPIIGDEISREIDGIFNVASSLGYNVTKSELIFFQIFYELLLQCTGALGKNANGGIIHGRNLDLGIPATNITAQVTWVRGGKAVFTSSQILGYQGIHTGMRLSGGVKGAGWSIQVNERVVLAKGPIIGYTDAIAIETVARFLGGGKPIGLTLRNILLQAQNFSSAIPLLSTTKLASPMYMIVAGGGDQEGIVITRDPNGVATKGQCGNDDKLLPAVSGLECVNPKAPSDAMQDLRTHPNAGPHLVETNWDNWISTTSEECHTRIGNMSAARLKVCDEYVKVMYAVTTGCDQVCQLLSDGRREKAQELMKLIPSTKLTEDSVLNVMSTPPVLQGYTLLTAIMSPGSADYYRTVVREHSSSVNGSSEKLTQRIRSVMQAFINQHKN